MHLLFVNYFDEQDEQLAKELIKLVASLDFCLLHYHYHAFIIKQLHFVQPNSLLRIIKVWLNVMRIHPLRIFSYLMMITQRYGPDDDDVMIFIHLNDDFLHVNVVFVNVHVHDEHFHYD